MSDYEGFVDIGGCRLYATVRGNGPAVVMERGADCGGVYGPLLDEIAEFATVVFYDRAGAGRSDPTATDYTVAGITANLRALLERLPVQTPAILAGWSLTGLSVLYHACKHPADVAGLVLIDSTPYDFFDDTSLAGRLARRKHANYRRIVELAPRGRHVLVENGSHMMSLDRPDAIVDAVRDVVAATSTGPG